MKEERITVRFPAKLRRRLKEAAHRSGRPESDLIRRAVEKQLTSGDQADTAYVRASKAGLIGVVRDASSDLSTNPKHFKGFGRS